MTLHNYARAVRAGWLPEEPYRAAALRAWEGLREYSFTDDGTVLHTCRGTGPQRTLRDYLERPTPEDDPHGVAAVMFAAAGRLMLD